VRVQKAHRLERDLGLNPAGAALALDLMAQIDELKTQIRRLQRDEL
jgi:chaperone modulatory protein CbpM